MVRYYFRSNQESRNFTTMNRPLKHKKKKTSKLAKHQPRNNIYKFRSIAQRIFFHFCSQNQKTLFIDQFRTQNPVVYLLIILAHVKIRMNEDDAQQFKKEYWIAIKCKIGYCQRQIQRLLQNNQDDQVIKQKNQGISEIQFFQMAVELYFDQYIEEAVECIYCKDEPVISKKRHFYFASLMAVSIIQKKLKDYPPGVLVPYLPQYTQNSHSVGMILQSQPCIPQNQKNEQSASNLDNMKIQYQQQIIEPDLPEKSSLDCPQNLSKTQLVKKDRIQPLSQLQNSYPIFLDFYKIVFRYNDDIFNASNFFLKNYTTRNSYVSQEMGVYVKIQNNSYSDECTANNQKPLQNQFHTIPNTKKQLYPYCSPLLPNSNQSFDYAVKFQAKFYEDFSLKTENCQHQKKEEIKPYQ